MFVSKKKLSKSNTYSVQLVKSYRINGKVRQSIIRYIGYAVGEEELKLLMDLGNEVKEMILKNILEDKITLFLKKRVSQIKSNFVNINFCSEICRKVIGIHDIYLPLLKLLNLEQLASNKNYNTALQNIILARILNPTSKRNSVNILQDDFCTNVPLSRVYRAMDKIDDLTIDRIKNCIYQNTYKMLKGQIKILFYDATTLYFESFKEDGLKQNGYSKDLKFNQPQVLLAVLVTQEGLPIGYEVFPGSTYEGHTLKKAITVLADKYHLLDLVLVADSGMLNQANIDYLEEKGMKYILGARLKNQTKTIKNTVLSFNKDQESFLVTKLSKNKRLIVNYKKTRAMKDKKDREKALERLENKLRKSKNPKNLLNNYGYKKFIEILGDVSISINEDKLLKEECWDGLHGVITNIEDFNPEEIYSQYNGLWQVEEIFRVNKSDLKIRPIYHWMPRRIKSHLALSYVAFSCVRTLQYLLKINGLSLSCKEIKYHLSKCQITTIKDFKSEKHYNIPSKLTDIAKSIYSIIGVDYETKAYELNY